MVEVGQWGPEPFLDRSGRPLTSLTLTVYETDGTTLADLYTDQDGDTALANPLPTGVATTAAGLDVRGNGNFYAAPGSYILAAVYLGDEVYRSPVTVGVDVESVGAVISVNGETGVVVLDAVDVGADATGTAAGLVATEADARADADALLIPLTQKAAANGVATLGADSLIPTNQLPPIALSEFKGLVASEVAMTAVTAEPGDYVIRTDFDPDQWFVLTTAPAATAANWLPITADQAVDTVNGQVGVVVLTKTDVGLGNVDNTSDADKPVSSAQQTALDGKVTGWPIDHTGAAAATDAIVLDVTGDTQNRFVVNHDGSIEWGSGAAVADVLLARSAANVLNLTGAAHEVVRTAGTDLIFQSKRAADASARFNITADGSIKWFDGAGDQQWSIINTSGAVLTIHNHFSGQERPSLSLTQSGTGITGMTGWTSSSPSWSMAFSQSAGVGNYMDLLGSTFGGWRVIAPGATYPAFVAKGAAAQTANLQEWQTSAAAVLMNVGPGGRIAWDGSTSSGLYASSGNLRTDDFNSIWAQALRYSSNLKIQQSNATDVATFNTSAATGGHTLVLKNVGSQTGDSQRWTDSSNAVLAYVTAGGNVVAPQAINVQTGTTYTIVAADMAKLVTCDNAGGITFTVPQDSDAVYPIGHFTEIMQLGAGQITVAAGSGATLRVSGLTAKARAQYSRLGVQKVAANTWSLYGDLAAS